MMIRRVTVSLDSKMCFMTTPASQDMKKDGSKIIKIFLYDTETPTLKGRRFIIIYFHPVKKEYPAVEKQVTTQMPR